MAEKTIYIMQPYKAGSRGSLAPGQAMLCKSAEEAGRRATKTWDTGRFLGIQVIEQTVDEEAGDYSEPRVLSSVGRVPEAA